MRFEGRRASELTPTDIRQLVDEQAAEDQWLDFKKDGYPTAKEGTLKLLKDVCSLANADGGFIVIGIADADGRAASLEGVPDAANAAASIRDRCLQWISPDVHDLESLPLEVEPGTAVVVIRIPDNPALRPHAFAEDDKLHFWKRHGNSQRAMRFEEIEAAFEERVKATTFAFPDGLREDMAEVARGFRRQRLEGLTAETSTLDATSTEEVRRIMHQRAEGRFEGRPYYRVSATPLSLPAHPLPLEKEGLPELLRRPEATEDDGWLVWESQDVHTTQEGWLGVGPDGATLILLSCGHIEYSLPCDTRVFQPGRTDQVGPNELYPYALIEITVNFTRLAAAVYRLLSLNGPLLFELRLSDINRFLLRPYLPGSFGYATGLPGIGLKPYLQRILTSTVQAPSGFAPDGLALDLVLQVYQAYGYSLREVPLFNGAREFDRGSSSAAP